MSPSPLRPRSLRRTPEEGRGGWEGNKGLYKDRSTLPIHNIQRYMRGLGDHMLHDFAPHTILMCARAKRRCRDAERSPLDLQPYIHPCPVNFLTFLIFLRE